jgi:Ca-activated chloride channel family protein
MMSFAHPERLLLAALAVVAFALAYRAIERRTTKAALTYSNLAFAVEGMRSRRYPAALLYLCLTVGVAGLATAIASPRLVVRVPVKDATVMLCIDTSGSMRATDLLPTRAEASKAAARSFLDGLPAGTRVGIVTFATEAALIQPPVDDLDVVRAALERIPPPNGATAIGDAIALAARTLPAHGSRTLVLMTDGVNNRGIDPVEAARQATSGGINIHTVGVGTNGSGQLIPGTTEPADLDEDTLRAIASLGHGTYASAQDAGSLSSAFRNVASATVWERKRIDGGTLFATAGGAVVVLTFLAGFAVGKFP